MSNLAARLKRLETSRGGASSVTDAELAEANRIRSRDAWELIKAAFERHGAPPCRAPADADAAPPSEEQLEWAAEICRRHYEHGHPGESYKAHLNRIHELGQERLRELGWIGAAETRTEEAAAAVIAEPAPAVTERPEPAPRPEKQPAPPLPAALR